MKKLLIILALMNLSVVLQAGVFSIGRSVLTHVTKDAYHVTKHVVLDAAHGVKHVAGDAKSVAR